MQLNNVKEKINRGKVQFTEVTFFMANYIKVNLTTRFTISELITESGHIEGLFLMIDDSLNDGEAKIGMGQGPTVINVKLF